MENVDLHNSSICIIGKNGEHDSEVEQKFNKMVRIQQNILDKFLEIDNNLDMEDYEDSSDEPKKRRKKWSNKSYEFRHVPPRLVQDDLDEIFGANHEKLVKRHSVEYKKNDNVTCILGKKKYKGTIFQINFKGVVIKTHDRKKIKLLWENIDGDNIQMIKIKNMD